MVSDAVYEADFNLDEALTGQFGAKKKAAFNALLREQKIQVNSNNALRGFFAKISEKVASLPVLALKIAVEPDGSMLQELSDWFPANIDRQVLIDLEVVPGIIAGAVLTFNGRYADYSVRPVFDRIFPEVLKPNNLPEAKPALGQTTAPEGQ